MKDMTEREKRWMPFSIVSLIIAIGLFISSAFVAASFSDTMIYLAIAFLILTIIFGALSSTKGTV